MYRYMVSKGGVQIVDDAGTFTDAIKQLIKFDADEKDDDFEIERVNVETKVIERFCYEADNTLNGRWVEVTGV